MLYLVALILSTLSWRVGTRYNRARAVELQIPLKLFKIYVLDCYSIELQIQLKKKVEKYLPLSFILYPT